MFVCSRPPVSHSGADMVFVVIVSWSCVCALSPDIGLFLLFGSPDPFLYVHPPVHLTTPLGTRPLLCARYCALGLLHAQDEPVERWLRGVPLHRSVRKAGPRLQVHAARPRRIASKEAPAKAPERKKTDPSSTSSVHGCGPNVTFWPRLRLMGAGLSCCGVVSWPPGSPTLSVALAFFKKAMWHRWQMGNSTKHAR